MSQTVNQMNKKTRTNKICKILRTTFPHVKTQLNHSSPFELLIATILSAQCTDKQVNSVTKKLFDTYKTPYAFAQAPIKKNLIPTTITSTAIAP